MLTRSPPFHDDAQTRSGIEAREQGKFYKTAAYESFLGGSFIGDFELREYVWSFFLVSGVGCAWCTPSGCQMKQRSPPQIHLRFSVSYVFSWWQIAVSQLGS